MTQNLTPTAANLEARLRQRLAPTAQTTVQPQAAPA